ncbi:MAG: hypothetical protein V4649_16005 [Bacteroidota bacterium]
MKNLKGKLIFSKIKKIVFIFSVICSSALSATAQRDKLMPTKKQKLGKIIPCSLELMVFPSLLDTSTGEIHYPKKSTVLIKRKDLRWLHIDMRFFNTSKIDTIIINSPFGIDAPIKIELFKYNVSASKNIFNNDEDFDIQTVFPEVAPGESDTFSVPIAADLRKIDVGKYIVKASYKQECGNKIKTKCTNSFLLQVIP